MKRTLFGFTAAALLATGSASADTLLNETFDSTAGFTTSSAPYTDGAFDYYGISDGDDLGTGEKAYTGFTGTYLTGMDLDSEGAPPLFTATWIVDITNYENLTFSGLFAEFFDSPGDIDDLDDISVTVQIDGGTIQTIIDFDGADYSSSSLPFNGIFRLDGTGTALGDAAQLFSAPIAGTGSTLTLVLNTDLDSGDEDFGVDNFVVEGDLVPEPTSLALLGLGGLLVARRRRG